MAETTIEVLRRRDVLSRDPARAGRLDRLIVYRVNADPTQVFVVELPAESWSEKAEQDAIAKAERDRRLTAPRRFTLLS